MLWRVVTLAILAFWTTMTWLIVERSYFGDASKGKPLAPAEVLGSYADHPASGSTLQLVHGTQKMGQGSFAVRRLEQLGSETRQSFAVNAGGMIESADAAKDGGHVSWRIDGDLEPDMKWKRLELRMRVAATDTSVVFTWHRGLPQPKLEVLRDGKSIMDMQSALAQGMMAQKLTGLGGLSLLPGLKDDAALETLIQLSAQEGVLTIAGSTRQTRVLKFSLLGLYEATAHFTDTGELARIDLPNDFQFVDPLILGLSQAEGQ